MPHSRAPVVTVGLGGTFNWRANILKSDIDGVRFYVESPSGKYDGEYELDIPGRYQATNALLAIAIGAEFGLNRDEIFKALKGAALPKMRMERHSWRGALILNDADNANPDSVRAALMTLSELNCAGKKIAVLGKMSELGEYSAAAHIEVGELAARSRIDHLIVVGEFAQLTADSALRAGLKAVDICSDAEAAAEKLKSICSPGDVVLLKASRSERLEKVMEFLNT